MTIRIAVSAGPGGDAVPFVQESERLGVHSVWTAEAWGTDALTPLAFFAAKTSTIKLGSGIVQVGARTPAMTAMSAMSMEYLSGGRFLLGLGTSGPQVMEGWHGVRFRSPIQRTRETIDIVRMISGGEKLAYQGRIYTLPLPDGPGRSIRSAAPPVHIPIYIASLGPANLRLTGELADGWVGTSFMPESADAFLNELRAGAEAAGRSLDDLDLQVPAAVEFTDDVDEAAKRHARGYGFTFGAMGSREQNFYLDAFVRQGYGDVVREVQKLWLDGERERARDLVPSEIGLKTNLLGSPDMVGERLRAYRDAGITTIRAGIPGESLEQRVATLGRLMDVANELNVAKV